MSEPIINYSVGELVLFHSLELILCH